MTLAVNPFNRLHSLDALRGGAALAVVFWHWQHFESMAASAKLFPRSMYPHHDFFKIFYDHGWLAVDLFFSLSGFIFFWLYSESVAQKKTTLSKFFILRFSRLYPLHILSLLLVAVGQIAYIREAGRSFFFDNTDLPHFVLNAFFAASFGLEAGYSFNAPAWSVSVECLLYVIFFSLCTLRLNRPAVLLVMSAIGFGLIYKVYIPIGRGVGSFFLGGFVAAVYGWVSRSAFSRPLSIAVIFVCIQLWLATVAAVYLGNAVDKVPLLSQIVALVPWRGYPEIVLFPTTILSLALYESQFSLKLPGLEFLGSISYSSYMLHFPLQVFAALLCKKLSITSDFFQTTASLFIFFVVLIAISIASFRYVEMPLQKYIRRAWFDSKVGKSTPIPGSGPA